MKRKIVQIDQEKCNGCGLCVPNCAEGAIQIIDGKARLVSETYCDGLGACLGHCPQGAITIVEREAAPFDESAVKQHLDKLKNGHSKETNKDTLPCGCPGSAVRNLHIKETQQQCYDKKSLISHESQLRHWPVQLSLVPPSAQFLKGCDLVVCADCVPFAVADFHERYLKGASVVVGCPKLDDIAFYTEKLEAIFREAQPRSIKVLRMEVPCCGGIVNTVQRAKFNASLDIPIEVHIIGIEGEITIQK